MGVLDRITGPRDLRDLSDAELDELATEIRDFLVRKVLPHRRPPRPQPRRGRADAGAPPGLRLARATGSSSTPATRPTCTRSLTGRAAGFDTLRQEGGLSGYPSQAESEHDIVENSHASTSLSLRRRAGQGLRDPRRGPARRRRDRRRRAHRRDGLGGAEQHRRARTATAGW